MVAEYGHNPARTDFGIEAAEALGVDPDSVFKTLVVLVDGAESVVVVPVTRSVSMKAVAAAFGLIHGFGFAGALAELPLPDGALWRPLLLFNLGVEAGQLVVVALALGAAWAAALVGANRARDRVTAAYLIGLPAGAWTVLRTADFLGV